MEIIKQAKEAAAKAYAPYSNFEVGCAIETYDGKFLLGANIENAAYAATLCAERSALANARMNDLDKKDIKAIAVYANSKKLISPCGTCRQVLSELVLPKTKLYLVTQKHKKEIKVLDLLPYAFNQENF